MVKTGPIAHSVKEAIWDGWDSTVIETAYALATVHGFNDEQAFDIAYAACMAEASDCNVSHRQHV